MASTYVSNNFKLWINDMVAAASTLLKTLLSTGLIAALTPMLFSHYRRMMIWGTLIAIFAFFAEALSISYLYIHSGRIAWTIGYFRFIDVSFALEPLGLIFLNLLGGLWFIAALYSFFYMRAMRDIKYVRLLTFLGLAIFAATIVALAKNLFTMFIGYEVLTLVTIPLVAHYGIHNEPVMKYLRILLFSSVGLFLPFIFLVQFYSGNTDFNIDNIFINNVPYYMGHLMLFMCVFGISKTAIFPLYSWLPSAMVAPYPVSALLHAVAVVKAGLFCIFKIIIYVFGFEYISQIVKDFNWPLLFAILTMLYASYKAVTHDSIKNILAYSTIVQLSLALLAAFLFTEKGMNAAIAHMISHSFSKIVLFFTAGRFYAAAGTVRVHQLEGLAYKMPATAIFFTIAGMSLIGLPLLAGYYSKHMILEAISNHPYSKLLLISTSITSLCTIYYLGKITYSLFSSTEEERELNGIDKNSIFKKFHAANSYAMDSATTLACICIVSFPIVEKFMQSTLWGIL